MPYTVVQLITEAFYLSGVRAKDFMSVGGDDITAGYDLLKKIMSGLAINSRVIPYYTESEFPAVIGQEKYFVPNLVDPSTITFNDGEIRYTSVILNRDMYHGANRVDNVESLPFSCEFEKTISGCNLFVYPLPCKEYLFKVWGKYTFINFSGLTQDISTIFDEYFIDYLEFYLAKRICLLYGQVFTPYCESELQRLSNSLNDMNVIDLTPEKYNAFSGYMSGNIVTMAPQWNIGKGFCPPSY
jgi:hypothetical protein